MVCAGLPLPCIRRGLWLRGMHRGAGGNDESVNVQSVNVECVNVWLVVSCWLKFIGRVLFGNGLNFE